MTRKKEVEVSEIWLDDNKIDELIQRLKELKENEEHIHFDDIKKNHLLLVHEKTEIV